MNRLHPANFPNWLRIALIALGGVWLVTIPFMFWRKARYTWLPYLGAGTVALIAAAAVAGGASEEPEPAATGNPQPPPAARATAEATTPPTSQPAPTPTSTPTPEPTPTQPGIGDLVRVGSLDLTVAGVELYDASQHNVFNDSNLRVEVIAVNARGGADSEYNISQFYFQLIDENGIAHDPEFACAGCPDAIDSIDLVRGGRVRGFVYFEAPEGRRLTELIYEPLFSTNKARIALQ